MSLLALHDIWLSFGGLKALASVGFEIERGEVFSIIGPNGAGKTTIFNCISRFYDVDKGSLVFDGRDITRVAPHVVAELGIARTFQNIELFKNMTVIENLLLGRHRRRRSNLLTEFMFTQSVRAQEIESREKAEEIIDFLDLQAYRDQRIGSLSYGVQKTVELGRALAMEPKLLLLDEPSSGLNMEETDELAFWISDIKEDFGLTILVVEHNMRLVKAASDRVLAMNFGSIITHGKPEEVLEHPEVMKAYLGEEDAAAAG
jgi:branched-chain amino acid transport system ATP-binding protein